MKSYIKNNINFRIVSSNAISQFKSAQAFDFNEISCNGREFSEPTREILLLEYEYWFKWILRVEKLFLLLNVADSAVELEKPLVTSIDYLLSDIEEVISYYPEQFSHELINYVSIFHQTYLSVLISQIKKHLKSEVYSAYPQLVNCVSSFLQQIVFILHDYDNNILSKKDNPFLSFTNISINAAELNGYSNLVERAEFFKEHFNINNFVLKNYSDVTNPESIIKKLTDSGINIIDIKTIKTKMNGADQ